MQANRRARKTLNRRLPLIGMLVSALAVSHPPTADAASWLDKVQGAIQQVPGQSSGPSSGSLTQTDIVAGLREALRVGTERVVGQIGASGGYLDDAAIHIPLPPAMQSAQSTLRRFGLSEIADEIEVKLNRAAEAAAPRAKEIVWNAIRGMTIDDATAIYKGPKDAATQYFQRVATADLTETVRPIVDRSLAEVGAIAAYDQLLGQYSKIPFVPDIKADLSTHATGLALKGLFHYLAQEEAAIRDNPARRSTELLMKVFGGP